MKPNFHDYERHIIALEQIVEFCRRKEIDFRKLKTKISGVELLLDALNKRVITMEDYINIIPAISNPETKYEIKIKNRLGNTTKNE